MIHKNRFFNIDSKDRILHLIPRSWIVSAMAVAVLGSGCAAIPDVKRIQSNMDQMVYYMGVMSAGMPMMVHNTGRMADLAERMERKTDSLLGDVQKKGGTAERAIQNYSQALLDNERAVINNLKGIKQELGDLKLSMVKPGAAAAESDQAKTNAALQARLNALESRLSAIASRLEKIDGNRSN